MTKAARMSSRGLHLQPRGMRRTLSSRLVLVINWLYLYVAHASDTQKERRAIVLFIANLARHKHIMRVKREIKPTQADQIFKLIS